MFSIKLKELIKDITQNNILGCAVAHIHVIEFQKRGLPHAHILGILQSNWKPRTEADSDRIVCAEIPDPEKFPRLYFIVTSHMLYGSCGAANPTCVCMDKDTASCTKHFPKDKMETTSTE